MTASVAARVATVGLPAVAIIGGQAAAVPAPATPHARPPALLRAGPANAAAAWPRWDRRVGIGDPAPGDVRRGTVDRFVQAGLAVASEGAGQQPSEPASIEASSVGMSPNMFSVTITS